MSPLHHEKITSKRHNPDYIHYHQRSKDILSTKSDQIKEQHDWCCYSICLVVTSVGMSQESSSGVFCWIQEKNQWSFVEVKKNWTLWDETRKHHLRPVFFPVWSIVKVIMLWSCSNGWQSSQWANLRLITEKKLLTIILKEEKRFF